MVDTTVKTKQAVDDVKDVVTVHNQSDIECMISNDLGIPQKTVKRVVDSLWNTIHKEVESGVTVRFQGVGRFYLSERSEHPARNLQTGEDIIIGRHQTLRFSPSRTYAKRLRRKTEQLSSAIRKQNKKAGRLD